MLYGWRLLAPSEPRHGGGGVRCGALSEAQAYLQVKCTLVIGAACGVAWRGAAGARPIGCRGAARSHGAEPGAGLREAVNWL